MTKPEPSSADPYHHPRVSQNSQRTSSASIDNGGVEDQASSATAAVSSSSSSAAAAWPSIFRPISDQRRRELQNYLDAALQLSDELEQYLERAMMEEEEQQRRRQRDQEQSHHDHENEHSESSSGETSQ